MRPADSHINLEELEVLRKNPAGLNSDQLRLREEISGHLKECNECSDLAETHGAILRQSRLMSPIKSCPEEQVWLEMAVGLVGEAELNLLLEHAATCSNCAKRLKEATEIVGPNLIESEIEGLASSSHVWQVELAARLRPANSDADHRPAIVSSPPHHRFQRLRFWYLLATAAVFLAAFVVWSWYRSRNSMDTMIAKAYDARRLTELRVPRGDSTPLYSPSRGAATSQDWPELLEIKLAAQRALQRDADSPYWHQILGRVYIVQSDPKSALAEFQVAYTRDPRLARIQFDLGTAYFELGEETRKTSNYGYAAESFSRFLDTESGPDPVTRYNRALCWARMGMKDLALQDFEEALKQEKELGWQREIRTQIESLKGDPATGASSLEPMRNSGREFSWTKSTFADDGYEVGLTEIFREGLSFENPVRMENLRKLAKSGEDHHDFWFSDWMEISNLRPNRIADDILSNAVRANYDGNANQAFALARRASKLYLVTKDEPGIVRAATEEIYALQRMGRARDCLIEIKKLQPSGLLRRYSYLRTLVLLEQGSCLEMGGSLAQSKGAIDRALRTAAAAGYPVLYARGQGFLASFLTLEGLAERGWEADVDGLWLCTQFRCPAMRQYQFLSDLTDSSVSLGLNRVSVLLAALGAQKAIAAGNAQISAYAFEVLGQRQVECARMAEAKLSFAKADSILEGLGDNPVSREYRADWSADRSELLAMEGNTNLALAKMISALPDIDLTQSLLIQLNYWGRRAILERETHRLADSLASAEKAVGYANQVLEGLRSPADRRAWQTNAKLAYITLVDSLLQNGRTQEAFDAWEAYRSAPDFGAGTNFHFEGAQRVSQSSDVSRAQTFVFARLINRYVVFVRGGIDNDLKVYDLASPPESLDQLVRTFSLLCSDPSSRLPELKIAGQQLFSILLPNALNDKSTELRIDGGLSFSRMPFNALTMPDGSFLGTKKSVILLSEFWTLHPKPISPSFSSSSRMLIVHSLAGGSRINRIPSDYDETKELADKFRNVQIVEDERQSRERILRNLGSTEIFHFSGHAVVDENSTRLILNSDLYEPASSFTPEALDGIRAPHCRLVVLAACTTLSGNASSSPLNSELPDAFLRAGAMEVIASAWDVDSQATKILMVAFYDELLEGSSPAVALMVAEGKVSRVPAFQHPYYWSAFSLLEA